jgi:alpha-glucosidase
VLVFFRAHQGERVVAAFNLSPEPRTAVIPGGPGTPLAGHGFPDARPDKTGVELPGFGAYFGKL